MLSRYSGSAVTCGPVAPLTAPRAVERKAFVTLLLLLLALMIGGCASAPSERESLTVFAASSLTDSFQELAAAYEESHPRADIILNFAASSQLATQIAEGAPADVFASAGEPPVRSLEEQGLVEGVRRLATNQLVVILPSDNPASVEKLEDLARPGLKLVTTGAQVPIGQYTREALALMDASGDFPAGFAEAVLSNVVSEETNVRQLVTKVQLGEADAAIVYATDLPREEEGPLRVLTIPAAYNVEAVYLVALVVEAGNPAEAESFVDFARSPQGLAILEKWGFLPP